MPEEAYPPDHPRHPSNVGKKFATPPTPYTHDYMPNHPARGGQGQPVPTEAGTGIPRDGFKHLHGLAAATLADAEKLFAALPKDEQEARLRWNADGVPPAEDEGAEDEGDSRPPAAGSGSATRPRFPVLL